MAIIQAVMVMDTVATAMATDMAMVTHTGTDVRSTAMVVTSIRSFTVRITTITTTTPMKTYSVPYRVITVLLPRYYRVIIRQA